jgi:hypothetical protein
MVDQRVLATTPVITVELRRGELAAEKTMRAYRGLGAAANMTTVTQGGWRSSRWSRSAGDVATRALELAEATVETLREIVSERERELERK